jgi:ATP adenylyltransferase
VKYVRKLVHKKTCVFCTSAKRKMAAKTLCVYKTKYSMIIVNKYPYNSGHLLVLPLRHCADLLDLSETESKDFFETFKLAVKAVQQIYKPNGINTGMNLGQAAGAGLPGHLHMHVIPRWSGDLNFFPLIAATKVVIEDLDQTWEKMYNWLNSSSRIKK